MSDNCFSLIIDLMLNYSFDNPLCPRVNATCLAELPTVPGFLPTYTKKSGPTFP